MRMRFAAVAAIGLLLTPVSPRAADLTFGRVTEQAAIDPHFAQSGNNNSTSENIFERLVSFDAHLQLHPQLALSWSQPDPRTWEIKLRPGVRFHDGTPLTARDVAYSLARVPKVPNSPAPWTHAVSNVEAVEVVDDLTLRVRTPKPTPLLMEQIGLIFVIPAHLGEDVTTADFNSGRAAIGSGPYRFRSWTPGERVVLEANRDWWGGKPEFDTVTLRFIPSNAARAAALLSGAVDVIDGVAPADVETLSRSPDIRVFSIPSVRLVYLALDSGRDETPFVTDRDGKPLSRNPLRDSRVRQAISMMINRQALTERVLNGAGEPAGQIVPEGQGGYTPDLAPTAYDPAGAKRLLAEAGYPEGFGLTLHSSSNRFPNDGPVAQAVGQMLTRGGLKMNGVEALPYSVYAPQATARKYSAFLFTWSSAASNSSEGLRSVLATYDAQTGMGALNRVRYSNAAFDDLLGKAMVEFDEAKRDAMLQEATRLAMRDAALVPLYWQKLSWATRKGLRYDANMGEESTVLFTHPAP